MTDMQTQDQAVTNYGPNQSGVNRTTQTTADPVTGASTRTSTTRAWSGKSPGVELVWLIAGIVIAFLALDFIFHATGANDVGFAAFVFSVGRHWPRRLRASSTPRMQPTATSWSGPTCWRWPSTRWPRLSSQRS